MSKTYKSEALAVAHEMAEGLLEHGFIDKTTMREFDVNCLAPASAIEPQDIRAIREHEHVSQAVFARYLTRPRGCFQDR